MITVVTQIAKGCSLRVFNDQNDGCRSIGVAQEDVLSSYTGNTITVTGYGVAKVMDADGKYLRGLDLGLGYQPEPKKESNYTPRPQRTEPYFTNIVSTVASLVTFMFVALFFYIFAYQISTTGCTPIHALVYAIEVFFLAGVVIGILVLILGLIFLKILKILSK